VCGATDARLRHRLEPIAVWQCRRCEQLFLWPLPPEETIRSLFATLYATGESPYPELRSYYGFCFDDSPANPLVQLYERWLGRLERFRPPGRLLDIGCGTGLFLAVARRRGWTPAGIDDCAEATHHARTHFGLDVETADFESFAWGDRTFDAVTMWDIIEHARRPVALLAAARDRITPGGAIAIATPNQRSLVEHVAHALYRMSRGHVDGPMRKLYIAPHFLYFTEATLAQAASRAGLETIHCEQESTELRRLTLAPPVRIALEAAFWLARRTRLENRLFAIAVRRDGRTRAS
jgi:SAM-dependent methyltransferase